MEILVLISFVIDGYAVDNIVKCLNMIHWNNPMLGKVQSLSFNVLNGMFLQQSSVSIEYKMYSKEMRTKNMLIKIAEICEENNVINFTCRCEAEDKLHTIFRDRYNVSYLPNND